MPEKPIILIVEDQFVEANHLRLMLKNAGYSISGIARSLEDARENIAAKRPGLVLLDIFLSGEGTGIELAGYLREEQIPFIYLSANSNEDILNAAKATQPYGFLVKPFREKDLLVTMAIARHHQEFGLESAMRRETLFRQQLNSLTGGSRSWMELVLHLNRSLQPLIPFDHFVAVYKDENNGDYKEWAYLRTGFDDYQYIGPEELQTISRLKAHELNKLRDNTPAETAITLYTGRDFERLCSRPGMNRLATETFDMHACLSLPVPLSIAGQGLFHLFFYSRRPEGFGAVHVAVCERLQQSLSYAVENLLAEERRASTRITPAPSTTPLLAGCEGIIGKDHKLLAVFDHLALVAPTETSVLITGESGTGKERIADVIHRLSPRKDQPLRKVNCAAMPASLVESELFGHEKGAFTGATERRIGRFEQAHNGTLFLDEIGDMPLEIQAKLLRVLQEKEIERVGGNSPIRINVRIIAATNRNLEKEVAEGRFRLDLYYRLNVFPIHLPALRERPGDIALLARHFIGYYSRKTGRQVTRIADDALEALLDYTWPGNIRELENLIERSVLLAKGQVLEDIFLPGSATAGNPAGRKDGRPKTIRENEREHIITVMNKCGGRIRGTGGAAEILGVPPTTLASKLQKLGIKKSHL